MSMQVVEEVDGDGTGEQTTGDSGVEGETDADDIPTEWPSEDGSVGESLDVTMDELGIASFLEWRGWGCLTLADGGAAYSLPMSFGYDGNETLYFQVQVDDDSRKLSYLESTTTATFLTAEVRPPDWTSVMVRGEISRVPDDELETAYAAFAENAWFPMCPWTPGKDPSEVAFYKLEAEELSGRTSLMQE